jgi:hypothetical protein
MRNRLVIPALTLSLVGCTLAAGTSTYPSPNVSAPASAVVGATGLKASVNVESGTSYAWTISGGTIQGSSTATSIQFTATQAGTLVLSCKATRNGLSSSSGATVSVTGTAPAAPVITAPASAYAGATGLGASVSAQSGCSYVWTVSNGTALAGAASNALSFQAGTAGTLTLTCKVSNAYGSASAQSSMQVLGLPPAAPVISAPATVLAQAAGLGASVPAQSGCSYSWTISNGTLVAGATSPAVTFNASAAGALTLACTVSNPYGSSSAQTSVTVQGIAPAAPAITTPASVSAGATGLAASVNPVSGVTYAWTVSGGSAVAGAASPTLTFSAGAPGVLTLACSASNAYGSSSAQTQVQVLASAPAQPVLTAPSQVVAQSVAHAASVQAQSGCSYAWSITDGTITGGQGTPAITFSAGAAGTLTLACTVTNAYQIALSAQAPVTVVNPTYTANGFYGSGLNVDALANTPVGKSYDFQVSQRFRANHSGALQALRPFFIWSASTPGYALGTGGTILIQIQTDDGSSLHRPSGVTLASTVASHPVNDSIGFYPLLSFTTQPQLQAGNLYHVVFSNIDPDPINNWVSVDSAYMDYASSPMQPTIADSDLATLWRQTSSGTWTLRKTGPTESYTPIMELDYADGASQGQGYMEFWIGDQKTISGAQSVRQLFTVSGQDRMVASASVRLKQISGSSPLTLRLEAADGTLIDHGTVASVPVTPGFSGASWAKVTFATPRLLSAGATYHLVLSAPADTVFTAYPMRKGSDKGFKSTTLFTDGYAQFNPGSGWTGWDQWGAVNRKDGDLQFYFEVVK